MKRRDFLLAGATFAGGMPWASSYAQSKPCPPSTLGVTGGSSLASSCAIEGAVPAWLRGMAAGAWGTVASGTGSAKVLKQVLFGNLACDFESGGVYNGTFQNGGENILKVWTGATMDYDRKEYLVVANGGHSDYPGNEAYALALWEDSPYWYRVNDPTPQSYLVRPGVGPNGLPNGTYPEHGGLAKYLDGRSRSMHTCGFTTYVNSKVWFPHQASYQCAAGTGGFGICSFDRTYVSPTKGPMAFRGTDLPQAHDGSAGPWQFYGLHPTNGATSEQAWSWGFSVYDPNTRKIWSMGQEQTTGPYWSVDPASGASSAFKKASTFTAPPSFWCACADRKVIVRGTEASYSGQVPGYETQVDVFYPETNSWGASKQTGPKLPGFAPFSGVRVGSVYWNGSIYCMAPYHFGRKIFKLTLPSDLNGSWDNAWSVIDVAGGPATDSSSNESATWNRLQLVTFGSVAALVIPTDVNQPTYVYRLA